MGKGKRPELPGQIAAFSPDIVSLSHDSFPRYALRSNQVEPARAITESIRRTQGKQFVVIFSRQAGKDELLAQIRSGPCSPMPKPAGPR